MRVRERQAVELALRTLTPFALLMPVLVVSRSGLQWWTCTGAAETADLDSSSRVR